MKIIRLILCAGCRWHPNCAMVRHRRRLQCHGHRPARPQPRGPFQLLQSQIQFEDCDHAGRSAGATACCSCVPPRLTVACLADWHRLASGWQTHFLSVGHIKHPYMTASVCFACPTAQAVHRAGMHTTASAPHTCLEHNAAPAAALGTTAQRAASEQQPQQHPQHICAAVSTALHSNSAPPPCSYRAWSLCTPRASSTATSSLTTSSWASASARTRCTSSTLGSRRSTATPRPTSTSRIARTRTSPALRAMRQSTRTSALSRAGATTSSPSATS